VGAEFIFVTCLVLLSLIVSCDSSLLLMQNETSKEFRRPLRPFEALSYIFIDFITLVPVQPTAVITSPDLSGRSNLIEEYGLARGVYSFDFARDRPEQRGDSSPRQGFGVSSAECSGLRMTHSPLSLRGTTVPKQSRGQPWDCHASLAMTRFACRCEADEGSRSNLCGGNEIATLHSQWG